MAHNDDGKAACRPLRQERRNVLFTLGIGGSSPIVGVMESLLNVDYNKCMRLVPVFLIHVFSETDEEFRQKWRRRQLSITFRHERASDGRGHRVR